MRFALVCLFTLMTPLVSFVVQAAKSPLDLRAAPSPEEVQLEFKPGMPTKDPKLGEKKFSLKTWGSGAPRTVKQCGTGNQPLFAIYYTPLVTWTQEKVYDWLRPIASRMVASDEPLTKAAWSVINFRLQWVGKAPKTDAVTAYCVPKKPTEVKPFDRSGRFYYSLGASAVYMDVLAGGAPSAVAALGWFSAELRFYPNWIWLRGEFGVGETWSLSGEDANSLTLSSSATVDFTLAEWFRFGLGGRHLVAFSAEGDDLNVWAGALALRFAPGSRVVVSGEFLAGRAWYPIYRDLGSDFQPAASPEVATLRQTTAGKSLVLAGGVSVSLVF